MQAAGCIAHFLLPVTLTALRPLPAQMTGRGMAVRVML